MKSELRLTDPNVARDASFIEQVKAALGLPASAQLHLQNVARGAQGGPAVEYAVTLLIKIEGVEFGVADGVTVDERVTASLHFDAHGALVSSQVSPIDEHHLRSVKDNVCKLAATNAIYLASPGETVDTDTLRAQRKPWSIAPTRKELND